MIYLTGDLHGDLKDDRLDFFNRLNKEDVVICLGDFGYNWTHDLLEEFNVNCTFLYVLGNHENYNITNQFPLVEMYGSSVKRAKDNVFQLLNGNIYEIEGKKFLIFGGANSIDKDFRLPWISWWPDEIPSEQEFKRCLDNIKNTDRIDYFLTHTCSNITTEKMFGYTNNIKDPVSDMIDSIEYFMGVEDKLPKEHYFGHHHKHKNWENHHCLYKQIINLNENKLFNF